MAFRICTIGCGIHAEQLHGPAYLKYQENYPDTVLAACCDINEEKARHFQEKFGYQAYYTDMFQMLEEEKPDAVSVIVSEPHICDTSIAVMKLGYPVLLEKPPGLCKADTMRMIEVAEQTGVINQVAFNRRYLPLLMKFKEWIHFHAKDTIQTMFYEFYRCRRTEPTFYTTAIHGIDAARYVIGSDYKEVTLSYQELPELGENVANIFLNCLFENGVRAHIHFCPCSGMVTERMCVHALDQTFFVNTPIWDGFDSPGELLHIKKGKIEKQVSGTELSECLDMYETNGFYGEIETFFDHVKKKQRSKDDLCSSLQSVAIAEAIKNRQVIWSAK